MENYVYLISFNFATWKLGNLETWKLLQLLQTFSNFCQAQPSPSLAGWVGFISSLSNQPPTYPPPTHPGKVFFCYLKWKPKLCWNANNTGKIVSWVLANPACCQAQPKPQLSKIGLSWLYFCNPQLPNPESSFSSLSYLSSAQKNIPLQQFLFQRPWFS